MTDQTPELETMNSSLTEKVISAQAGSKYRDFSEMPDDALRGFADALAAVGRRAQAKPKPKEKPVSYAYIKQTYGVSPEPGKVVYHKVTKQWGVIKREDRSASHYVQVTFEGARHAVPCHPTELQYDLPQPI